MSYSSPRWQGGQIGGQIGGPIGGAITENLKEQGVIERIGGTRGYWQANI